MLNEDFLDLLRAFTTEGVEFVVVGAHALAVHGVPRATGDLDVFVNPQPTNAARVIAALRKFGAPLEAHGITTTDFCTPGLVYQVGLPPRRIDLLTELTGVTFDEASRSRVEIDVGGLVIAFIGRDALVRNKRAVGRPKDLVDAGLLERQQG